VLAAEVLLVSVQVVAAQAQSWPQAVQRLAWSQLPPGVVPAGAAAPQAEPVRVSAASA
jgi:hypothetical protein